RALAARGGDLLVAADRGAWRRARARFALARASLVLCDARNLAAAAVRSGADRAVVRALPWGVDRSLFRPAAAREPGLLLSTRMHEDVYDLPRVIDAAARVLVARSDAQLVLAGDGSRRLAREPGADRGVLPGPGRGPAAAAGGGRVRRALVLAYFYPPLAGGGVHRVLSFTRHLPAHGWACTVVCAGERDYWVSDPS